MLNFSLNFLPLIEMAVKIRLLLCFTRCIHSYFVVFLYPLVHTLQDVLFPLSADTEAERNALKEHVYPKLRDFCRENYGIEFQVVDLYWGVDPEEWDSPDLQRLRMKLLEECLKTSAGPCFVLT
uniref:NACHT and WD repeat domain containing 2 n=1 Tax=Dicentrarchus labrax TaxID=13489 RepID=A0A8P4K896_DICLA